MKFAQRDDNGNIIGHSSNQQIFTDSVPIDQQSQEWLDYFSPDSLDNKAAELAILERSWRDNELRRADIEINKVEDIAGTFGAATWRAHRINLRDWPADPAFPDSALRPAAPDKV